MEITKDELNKLKLGMAQIREVHGLQLDIEWSDFERFVTVVNDLIARAENELNTEEPEPTLTICSKWGVSDVVDADAESGSAPLTEAQCIEILENFERNHRKYDCSLDVGGLKFAIDEFRAELAEKAPVVQTVVVNGVSIEFDPRKVLYGFQNVKHFTECHPDDEGLPLAEEFFTKVLTAMNLI